MHLSHLLSISASILVLQMVEAGFICCNNKQAVEVNPKQRRFFKTNTYQSKGVPSNLVLNNHHSNPNDSQRKESIVSSSGSSSLIAPSSPELSQWAQSTRYRLGSKTFDYSKKALQNANVLPSDPIEAEVDFQYGVTTRGKFKALRIDEREARRKKMVPELYKEPQKAHRYRGSGRLSRHKDESDHSPDEW